LQIFYLFPMANSTLSNAHHKLCVAGIFISLGIIYGDIGTSPLYVLSAIITNKVISEDLVYGGISAVFWTITLLTTVKYVIYTLQADNNGEGGIFSLFALLVGQLFSFRLSQIKIISPLILKRIEIIF
jgi:KUP system potassium uptake protein